MEYSVLEMEISAIALIAVEYNVPLLALRGVSDNPKEPLPVDPDTVMGENYHLQQVTASHPHPAPGNHLSVWSAAPQHCHSSRKCRHRRDRRAE